jgi:glycosyltransferase involved in cell wall biosynthesis
MPLFSIIIPTLDVESTIGQCLDSIATQTCRDCEVVIVDGVSKDKTADIATGFATKLDGRLRIDVRKDDGIYDAMNRGIGLAGGQWLLFLGADDVLFADDVLARTAVFLAENPSCQLAYGDVILRSDGSRYGGAFDLDTLLFRRNICHQAIFYRRELFSQLGPYNLRYRIWADWDFNIRCFKNPALVARHMDIVVSNYNDLGGKSQQEDPELRKRLPVPFLSGLERTWMGRLATVAKHGKRILRRQ